MASDAKHKEIDHHSPVGKHPEPSHKDLIHHANGVPKAKPEVHGKVVEEKHPKTAPKHDALAAKHPDKKDAHELHDKPAKKPEHHDDAKPPAVHDKKSNGAKTHEVAGKGAHDSKKPEHNLPHVVIEKSHSHPDTKPHPDAKAHPEAKPHSESKNPAEMKHLEAVRNQLQASFAKEGMAVVVQEKSHVAGKTVTLEAKALPPEHQKPAPEVHPHLIAPVAKSAEAHPAAPAPAPADNSTYHAVTSYLASTTIGKAFESWTSGYSHPQTEAAKATAPEISPVHHGPKSKAAMELEALQRGDCGGARTPIIEDWTTHNEVAKHKYTSYTPNDNNTGIAVGELQWNQKKGSLPDLLRAWHHEDAQKFDQIFGKYSKDLLGNKYVKKADFNGLPELLNGMHTALADKEFQGVQDSLRTKQIFHYCQVAHAHGFFSIRGEGYVADGANQLGLGAVEKILGELDRYKNTLTQSERIDRFRDRTNVDRQNGKSRNERVTRGSNAVFTVVANLKKQVQLADVENAGK